MKTRLADCLNKNKNLLFYALVWLTFLILSYKMVSQADDLVFAEGITRYDGIAGWAKFFYANWGGRIIPQGILVLILQLPEIVFHLIDAFMWVIFLGYANKIYNFELKKNRNLVMILMAVLIFTIVPSSIITGTLFWKCANVLYLWGTALSFVALYPLVCIWLGEEYKKRDIILAVLAAIYASSFEQIAVFMCIVSVSIAIAIFVRERKISKEVIICTAVIWLFSILFLISPGNSVRTQAEMLWWYQEFGAYSLPDKVLAGICYTLENVEREIPIVLFGISVLLLSLGWKRKDYSLSQKISLAAVTVYFLLNYLFRLQTIYTGPLEWLGKIFQTVNPDSMNFALSCKAALAELVNIGMIAMMCINIGMVYSGKFDVIGFSSILGAFATIASMGFSPTIYASEGRPRMVGYLIILIILVRTVILVVREKE